MRRSTRRFSSWRCSSSAASFSRARFLFPLPRAPPRKAGVALREGGSTLCLARGAKSSGFFFGTNSRKRGFRISNRLLFLKGAGPFTKRRPDYAFGCPCDLSPKVLSSSLVRRRADLLFFVSTILWRVRCPKED